MAKLIGTAGHVDHGKTTLIQALTGIDADRLPEEKARGMTIDIGFAYVDLPRHGRVSIVDVPGHERFVTNMLVGAMGIDVALLCVAADESVMRQTREHFQILDLLPVDRLVVAMTRSDLADEETREITRAEISEMLAPTRFAGAPMISVVAPTGEGIDELKAALDEALSAPEQRRGGNWYLPIDRAFTVKGHGTVVTGTLMRGQVKEGDDAVLLPGGQSTRIRGIQRHARDQKGSEYGMRTALNLAGLKLEEVRRGMAVGAPGALFETKALDARVRWAAPAKHGMAIRVSVGAEEGIGKLFLNDHDAELVQLRLERPIAVALGQPLIVRRYSPPDVLCGGRVSVPQAAKRRKSEAAVMVDGAPDESAAVLKLVESKSDGATTEFVCQSLGRTPQDLGELFERLKAEDELLGFAGLWFTPESFQAASGRLLDALERLHEEKPTQGAWPREAALRLAHLGWKGKPLDRIVAYLVEERRLRAAGTEIAHADFRVRLNDRQRELLERTLATLTKVPVDVPGPKQLAEEMRVPVQAVEEILRVGIEAGEVVRLADGIFYTPQQLERIRDTTRELAAGGAFTAAQFRDALGTTRKYAIPLLEHLDSTRFTLRQGDLRVLQSR